MISERMVRAARLEAGLYEEVEADQSATQQAFLVVVIAAVAAGIGNWLASGRFGALIAGLVATVIGWVIWSFLTYWIGTKLFNGTATPGEMLRTIGFSHAPGVLHILDFIPALGALISLIVSIWVLIAGVIAVRQALDFTTGKAVLTVIIGWAVVFVLSLLLGIVAAGAMMVGGAV